MAKQMEVVTRLAVLGRVVLTSMAFVGMGCGTSLNHRNAPPETWQVVNVDDGREVPVAGASLLFFYKSTGSAIVDSSDFCVGTGYAVTDAAGKATLPASARLQGVYKQGLVYARPYKFEQTGKVPLRHVTNHADKINSYRNVMFEVNCSSAHDRTAGVRAYLASALPDLRREPLGDESLSLILKQLEKVYEEVKEGK